MRPARGGLASLLRSRWRSPRREWDAQPLEPRTLLSTLLPIASPRDLVFDPTRGVLYATSFRDVARYDVNAGQLLDPWRVGLNLLNGLDVTPDGGALYVADTGYNASNQPGLRKVNTAGGAVTNLDYTPGFRGASPWDVAVTGNGKVFFTTQSTDPIGFSVPLHQVDVATGAMSTRGFPVPNNGARPFSDMLLARGGDFAAVLMHDAGGRTLAVYETPADAFPHTVSLAAALKAPAAVSRDSSLAAVRLNSPGGSLDGATGTYLFDRQLNFLRLLRGIDGGMAFDPAADVFYGVNSSTDELVAFDTRTWEQKYRLSLGMDVAPPGPTVPGATGATAVSGDGTLLFLALPNGVRVIHLPQPTGQAVTLRVGGFRQLVKAGGPARFTLTAYDPAGNPATGYRGTVRFSASDVAAGLPAEYTYTAADAGTHEFTATLRTAGTQSLSAVDVTDGSLVASQAGITVHAGDPWLLPIRGARDLVFDDANDRLLVATADGNVETYDLASQSMRRPLRVGSLPTGIDVTPDGSTVYAADGLTGPLQGVFAKVRMADGSVTPLRYPTTFTGPGPARDVVVAANGKAVTFRAGATAVGVIDVPTDAYAYLPGADGAFTVSRGADRRTVLLQSDTGVYLYDADSGAVILARTVPGLQLGFAGAAVNPDGTMLAVVTGPAAGQTSGAAVLDRQPEVVRTLPGLDGGLAFDRSRALLYGVDSAADALVAYDTVTWQETFRRPIGEDLPAAAPQGAPWVGGLATSDDGRWLFLITPTGVRVFGVPDAAGVAGRHLFYNHSAFDGRDPGANPADDGAIAPATAALLPGQPGGPANVTGYSPGINGIMIDLFGYQGAGGPGAVGAAGDFEIATGTAANPSAWAAAPAPAQLTVRKGAGDRGSDRVTLTWPDGTLRNLWVRVTVKPTAATGLLLPDVFYFGSLAGDTGGAPRAGAAVVDAADYVATRDAVSTRAAGITNRFDVNHDGRVNARDLADVRRGLGNRLPVWEPAAVVGRVSQLAPSRARPVTRGLFGTLPILS